MKGILLLGHGARNPDWAAPFHRIRAAILQRQPQALVEIGFLELMRPTFDESIDVLVGRGVRQIAVVPIFMSAGVHVRKELPLRAGEAMTRHAGLDIQLAEPIGEVPEVIAVMAEYALAS